MSGPAISSRALLLALATLSVAPLGCAAEQPGFRALVGSANARIRRRPPEPIDNEGTAWRAFRAGPLTADTATRVALIFNRRVHAAYEELGVAHGELVHALHVPNPTAEAALRFKPRGRPGIDLMASIGLGELALLPLRSAALNAEHEAKRLALVGFIVDLAFDVRAALIDYQAAEQSLELTRKVLAATQADADAAARLHEAGNLTDLELASARAFNQEARIASRRAQTQTVRARARLGALMGVDARTAWPEPPKLPDPPAEELALDGLENRARAQNLDLAVAKQRGHAADKRADVAGVESWVPELRAGVVAERDENWSVGPVAELELPLFYWGQGASEAAEAERSGQASLHAQLSLELGQLARAAAQRLVACRTSALEFRDVLLPLRRSVLDQTELSYNAMAVGVFQLLAAKRAELEAELTYVDVLKEYWRAREDVERLEAGSIDLASLDE